MGVAALKKFRQHGTSTHTCLLHLPKERSARWNRPLGSLGSDECESLCGAPNLHAQLTLVLTEFLGILRQAQRCRTRTLPARNIKARRCHELPVADALEPGSRFPRSRR